MVRQAHHERNLGFYEWNPEPACHRESFAEGRGDLIIKLTLVIRLRLPRRPDFVGTPRNDERPLILSLSKDENKKLSLSASPGVYQNHGVQQYGDYQKYNVIQPTGA